MEQYRPAALAGRRVYDTGEAVEMEWGSAPGGAVSLPPGDYQVVLTAAHVPAQGEQMIKGLNIARLAEDIQ